jgi:hypothetical protein
MSLSVGSAGACRAIPWHVPPEARRVLILSVRFHAFSGQAILIFMPVPITESAASALPFLMISLRLFFILFPDDYGIILCF